MTVLRLLLIVRWRQALGPTLAVAALIGAIGGFALASATAARRVEGSYRALINEVDAPDLVIRSACDGSLSFFECTAPSNRKSIDAVLADLRTLNVVQEARSFDGLRPFFVKPDGAPLFATRSDPEGCGQEARLVEMTAIGAGGPTEQAIPFRLDGDLPTHGSTDVVLARVTAERAGLAIGDTLHLAGFCDNQWSVAHRLGRTIDLLVTGLSIGPLDTEPPGNGRAIETAYVDPSVIEALITRGAETEGELAVWLQPTASAASVAGGLAEFEVFIDIDERAGQLDGALAADARLLWLLAAVGAIGGILVLSPIIDRSIRQTGPRTAALSAIGATRRQVALQATAYGVTLAVLGGILAAVLAVPLSAVMPRGLAGALMPDRRPSIDWLLTFAGFGLTGLVVVLIGVIVAWKISTTTRSPLSRRIDGPIRLRGLAPTVRTGVQAAVGASAGPRRANPWTTLVPMLLVGTVGVASLTYLAGLRHLEKTPTLLGWNWDALVGLEQSDPEQMHRVMTAIAETDGIDRVTAGLAFPTFFPTAPDTGLAFIWPWVFATGADAITPTMLSGLPPASPDEVAIDHLVAEQTGLEVGDAIALSRPTLAAQLRDQLLDGSEELGLDSPTLDVVNDEPIIETFEITGIALLPLEQSVSLAQVALTFEGYAAFAPTANEIASAQEWLPIDLVAGLQERVDDVMSNVNVDANAVFVRYSGDESSIASALATRTGVSEVIAPSPEELWRQIGLNLVRTDRVPVSLAFTVAGLYLALIGFLLFASVRARRFEFAVMRALGMATNGIRLSVAAQATTTALVSLIVAVPAGVLVGRWAWLGNARDLNVLPVSAIPWMTLAIACAATIALANIAALCLGWPAIGRSSATDLRSE